MNGSVENAKTINKQLTEMATLFPIENVLEEDTPDFGICDKCGEYMNDLITVDGEWICQNCENFI